jgi:hypothetical protein
MSRHNGSSDANDVEIADPDDYTTSQRLKQIYRAREDLRKMRRKASKVRHRPDTRVRNKMRAVQYYRTGVESYLLEVDTLLRQFEPGPELWHNRDYGTVTIEPPGQFEQRRGYYVAQNMERGNNQPLKVTSIPDPKELEVTGLKWLFNFESPVTAVFEYDVQSHIYGKTVTKRANAVISWTQLNSMVTDVNSFLGELGIGLDTDNNDEWTI